MTTADKMLTELLKRKDSEIATVIQAALEYSDHPSLRGAPGLRTSERLGRQLMFAMDELDIFPLHRAGRADWIDEVLKARGERIH